MSHLQSGYIRVWWFFLSAQLQDSVSTSQLVMLPHLTFKQSYFVLLNAF